MASTKSTKKTTGASAKKKTSSKTSTKAKKPAAPDNTPPPEFEAPPIRRELTAVVFLLLAIFTVISIFSNEGIFIQHFSDFMKGLIGWGYWLIAPSFLLIAYILGFHRGRPVSLRAFCAFLIPMLFASLWSVISYILPAEEDLKLLAAALFDEGQQLKSAGALSGLLAIGLEKAFSGIGAFIVLVSALVFCIIASLNSSLASFKKRVSDSAHKKYDPAKYEDEVPVIGDVPGMPQQEAPKAKAIEKRERPKSAPAVQRRTQIDIPLGTDDEDALTLLDPKERYTAPAENTHKVKLHKKQDSPTDGVKPMSDAELAAFTGVEIESIRREEPAPNPPARVAAAEVSDPPKSRQIIKNEVKEQADAVAAEIESTATITTDYEFPPVSLLRSGKSISIDGRDEVITNRERLEGAIHSFGISANVVGVTRGPTVTRYDIELDQGVKLSRITNLAGDLALALGVINVRIAPIPEKISTVGIEVPNKIVSTVYLRDIIESQQFTGAKSKLSFAIGKDIGGDCVVGNISKLPHMLIAGTTGSGKSVCMNSLILSLLYKARPDEVKFIMIDPKMVELGIYNGIPHLYVPVVTDPKKAAGALQWSVVEMLKRYRLFSEVGVRDLASYNKHCEQNGEESLPQVVIVIDELADLMLVASKEVEESICRVAQMGRAAGMHLVIATQRPSADVITGLMKANIPSRIAFAVSSAMESRIILDQGGAEKLVGMGDMLYSPVGCGKPTRIQGAFVSDEEREDVIQFIKEGCGVNTNQNSEIVDFMNKAAAGKDGSDSKSKGGDCAEENGISGNFDEMLPQAVEVVLEMKSCSVSMLQRRIKLGYARAARIVDQMEELGVVGPYEGAKPRSVIVDREGWHAIQVQLGLASDDEPETAAEMPGADDDFE